LEAHFSATNQRRGPTKQAAPIRNRPRAVMMTYSPEMRKPLAANRTAPLRKRKEED
jgi:hypothetical protein